MKNCFLFLLLFCFCQNGLRAQSSNKTIDSLLKVLQDIKEDTSKLRLMSDLGFEYLNLESYEKAMRFANDILTSANNILKTEGKEMTVKRKVVMRWIGNAYSCIGGIGLAKGDFFSAEKNYQAALKVFKEIEYKKGIADTYKDLGDTHLNTNEGNDSLALTLYLEAIKIAEEMNDKQSAALISLHLGIGYTKLNKTDDALKTYLTALKIFKEWGGKNGIGDKLIMVKALNKLSRIYINKAKNDAGMKYANDALDLANQILDGEGKEKSAIKQTAREEIANAYHNIALLHYWVSNYPEALKNNNIALKIREEIGDKMGLANSYNNIGLIYNYQGNYTEALKNYLASLKIREEMGDKAMVSGTYINIGVVYKAQGNYPEALKNITAALKIFKEFGDKNGIAVSYNNLGTIYQVQGNYPEALKNYLAALKIREEIGAKTGIAISYNNIGIIYKIQGNYPEALKNQIAALKMYEEMEDKARAANTYREIGSNYHGQGNDPEALKNFMASLKISEKIGDKPLMAMTHIDIGSIYFSQGNYTEALKNLIITATISEEVGDKEMNASAAIQIGGVLSGQAALKNITEAKPKFSEALQYLNKGLLLAKEIGAKENIKDAYNYLAEVYKGMNDYKKALEYNNLYVEMKDSLMNNETTRKLEQQRTQYEVEKAVAEERVQQEKTLTEQRLENEKRIAEEQAKKEKALEIAKLKYDFAIATAKTEEEKLLAAQQFENEKKLAEENARHQQSLADEKAKQSIKDAESQTLLEKEKAERRRKAELYITLLFILGLVSIFAIVLIRQRNLKRRAVDKAETGHKMAELELQSLRAQLNPHFMFNSLNAIQDLIVNENNEKSHLYLARFAKLLRMLLDNANQPFVSLKQELEFLELYLSLENLRIPNLQFSIEKDPKINMEERMVPNMMLQPYIENAIWHGLSNKKNGERKLQVRIHENGSATEFEIEDNGIGRKRAAEIKAQFKQGHHSKGMELLSKRFNLLSSEYGEAIHTTVVDLTDNGNATGTLVKIDVPFTLSEQAKKLAHDTNHHN